MVLLDRLENYASAIKSKYAFINNSNNFDRITYGDLKEKSDKLAQYISKLEIDRGKPIVVYGHKQHEMIVAFLACVKSGHPYCPVDISMPKTRLADIIDASETDLLIAINDTDAHAKMTISIDKLNDIVNSEAVLKEPCEFEPITGDEVYYIIFTSGSTGKPKGVQITANCLDNFLKWIVTVGDAKQYLTSNVFLNQAPFSFDLSVMDVYTSLYSGGTIWSLDKQTQGDYQKLYDSLGKSHVTVWVSTPSFMNMCLLNKAFDQSMMEELRLILFCGEVLPTHTAEELIRRFPKAKVVNTYGPTESTVAVTQIVVEEHMTKDESLSIGYSKPGSPIYIMHEEQIAKAGEKGEIVITGDTLAKGYLNLPEQTDAKFVQRNINGEMCRCYLTGDEGYFDNLGRLYYIGRIDFQLKLHGYRIELGDIENNIMKNDSIRNCVVLPIVKNGVNKALAAIVVPSMTIDDEFEFSQSIRNSLKSKLPEYMVPQRYIFIEKMPMTVNGKIDRKALAELI